jgi:tetratricopeptide (TPR) repeat protein
MDRLAAWRPLAAQSWFESALWLRPANPDALNGLLRALYESGDLAAARITLDSHRAALGRALEEAHPRALVGWLQALEIDLATDRAEHIPEDLQELVHQARKTGDESILVRAGILEARWLYSVKGQDAQAMVRLRKLLESARESGDRGLEAEIERQLGIVRFWFRNDQDTVLEENFIPAMALFTASGDRRGEAWLLSNMAHVHNLRGDFPSMLETLEAALVAAREVEDRRLESALYSSLARLYLHVENFEMARTTFERSLDLARSLGQGGIGDSESFLARIALQTGDVDGARERLMRLLDSGIEPPITRRYRLGALADVALTEEDYKAAEQWLREGLTLDRELGQGDYRYSIWTATRLAEALSGQRRYAEALETNREAADRAAAENERSWNWLVEHRLVGAEIAAALGDTQTVWQLLSEAAEAETQWLSSVHSHFGPVLARTTYDRLFGVLLESVAGDEVSRGPLVELALRFELQRRQHLLLNFSALSTGASATLGGKAYASDDDSRVEPPDPSTTTFGARPRLGASRRFDTVVPTPNGPRTAFLVYLAVANDLFAFVQPAPGGGPLVALKLSTDLPALRSQTLLLEELIFRRSDIDWRPVSRALAGVLIEPIEARGLLGDAERLAILVPRDFESTPFSALSRSDSPLIERYSIVYPALGRSRTTRPHATGRVLTMGLTNSSHGSLPLAGAESHSVATLAGDRAFIDDSATEALFKERSGDAVLIHLATHSIRDPRWPGRSYLELTPGASQDGQLRVEEIARLQLRARLVLLAGCQTAASAPPGSRGGSGYDRFGLVEAFLLAGAESVLASTTDVSDRATFSLVQELAKLLDHLEPSEALAQAQRSLLNSRTHASSDRDLSHPRNWSAFVLIGPATPPSLESPTYR